MSTHEIASQLERILSNNDNDNFIYDFLLAYGISKSVVTRLRKGDQNRSKRENEVLYPKKIIFRVEASNNLLNAIDGIGKDAGIQKHSPRFAIMTDFKHLVAKDLKLGKALDIELKDLPRHYDFFLPLAGSEVYHSANDNEADRNAAYKMATLYDHLIEGNSDIYQSKEQIHHLNVFLSRLLFCFFAEDTGIFPEDSIFTNTLGQHTAKDGTDTHIFLDRLFARLDSKDTKDLPKFLADFPYVNGGLFRDKISSPVFSAKAQKILMELGELQWKNINPDIFGSMIQAVTTGADRSKLGQHYTSVPNILKLIKPLFLDEFYEELEKATTVNQLYKLQNRIAKAKFFDPACGSGNFLIITYKELRVLEIEIIKKAIELSAGNELKKVFASQISISKFYGIEIDDFAHEIAILSLWLAEHQMNIIFEERLFGFAEVASILPLKSIANIIQGNSTRLNWEYVCPISETDEIYVIGNPPYEGSRKQTVEQKSDLKYVFGNDYKSLDYICAWFYLGVNYIRSNNAKCALVSTNSISQGILADFWNRVLVDNIEICYAYPSFKWKNNAKGNAGVTVVIIGIRNVCSESKYIYEGQYRKLVKNINPYLEDKPNIVIKERTTPISKLPIMAYGNMPLEGCHLRMDEAEYEDARKCKGITKFIRKVIGGDEFLSGVNRYCFWIEDDDLEEALKFDIINDRVEKVRKFRQEGGQVAKTLVKRSHQFRYRNSPKSEQIIIPCTSSEEREYIPCGIFDESYISLNSAQTIYDALPYIFAVVSSKMHILWVKAVGGKLETRPRYSAKLCYNTFPFPEISEKQKELLHQYAFDILETRANYVGKNITWMYNRNTMPKDLKQAHEALDKAVEQCYRLQPFNSDSERLEYLFKLYEKMIAEETSHSKPKKSKR